MKLSTRVQIQMVRVFLYTRWRRTHELRPARRRLWIALLLEFVCCIRRGCVGCEILKCKARGMGLAVVGKLMHRRQVLRSLASIDIVFDVWKSVLCSGKQWIPFFNPYYTTWDLFGTSNVKTDFTSVVPSNLQEPWSEIGKH